MRGDWSWVRVWMVGFSYACALGLSGLPSTAQEPTSPHMFRGAPHHSGVSELRGVPQFGRIRWRFQTDGPVRSSPVRAEGVVYVGSTDGYLYALDELDGTVRWSFRAHGAIASSPALVADLVIFGDRTNRYWALNRSTGSIRWSFATGPDKPLAWGLEGWDYFTSSPTIHEESVYFGSGDGGVYALDWRNGRQRWKVDTDRRIRSTPAVRAGLVYIGGGDGIVRALDATDGAQRWAFETAGIRFDAGEHGFDRTQIQASPAVVGGTVYIGSRDASLYALDAVTGAPQWHREDGSAWVVGSAAVGETLVFNGRSSSGTFRARDRTTGEEVWAANGEGAVFTSPTLADGLVYFGSGGGWLWALQAESGEVAWRYHLGRGVYSSPLIADGSLYVGSDDGSVYAIEEGSTPGPIRAVFWDDTLSRRALFGRGVHHRIAADYFQGLGYERLGAGELASFLAAREQDHVPSVIVFAMDFLPPPLGDGGDSAPLRRFLDKGGKVVWLGYPPTLYRLDAAGASIESYDLTRPTNLLGVDLSSFNTDTYGAEVTDLGRLWGLRRGWVGEGSVTAAKPSEILARNEVGDAMAWARNYGGPTGTGFVLLPPTTDASRLNEYRWVAEFGVTWSGRSGDSREGAIRPSR